MAETERRPTTNEINSFFGSLPPLKKKKPVEETIPPWESGMEDFTTEFIPGTQDMEIFDEMGSSPEESGLEDNFSTTEPEEKQRPIFEEPSRKHLDAYIAALENAPRREDYKVSGAARIGARLLAIGMAGKGRAKEGMEAGRAILDRPYESAYGKWMDQIKGLKAGADVESDFDRNRDYAYRAYLQEQRDQARNEKDARNADLQLQKFDQLVRHQESMEARLNRVETRKEGAEKWRRTHALPRAPSVARSPMDKPVPGTEQERALNSAAVELASAHPEWVDFLEEKIPGQYKIMLPGSDWNEQQLQDYNRFRAAATNLAIKKLQTNRGQLGNRQRFEFQR